MKTIFLTAHLDFDRNRNCHDALKILNYYIEKRHINYVVDADIKGFFDNVDHKWMMEFLKHRINDPNLLRILGRFLKGGYMEEGKKYKTDMGTPQGGVISPIVSECLSYIMCLTYGLKRRLRKNVKVMHIS